MRHAPPLAAALVGALLCVSCGSDGGPNEFAAFDEALEAYLTDNGLAGATAVIVHRDEGIVHLRGYGSFDVHRISLLASSSKILSVGVVMRLVDQGILDLDTPISDYLGADWGAYKTDITLAQMLSNSSGMVGLIDDPTYAPYLCQYLSPSTLGSCAEDIYTADDAMDRVTPDTEFHYGGGQWQLAGGLAAHVSGKSWDQLVQETYVGPCGLDVLGYTNQYTQAYLNGGGVGGAFGYPTFFSGNVATLPVTLNPNIEGGAYTTARDYGEILLMHLRGGMCDGGRVLAEASVARMQEDRIGSTYGGSTGIDTRFEGYGLGWWVSRDEAGVVADSGAYGATPWLDVERGYGVMVIVEGDAETLGDLFSALKPIVDGIFDAMAASADAG